MIKCLNGNNPLRKYLYIIELLSTLCIKGNATTQWHSYLPSIRLLATKLLLWMTFNWPPHLKICFQIYLVLVTPFSLIRDIKIPKKRKSRSGQNYDIWCLSNVRLVISKSPLETSDKYHYVGYRGPWWNWFCACINPYIPRVLPSIIASRCWTLLCITWELRGN